jgi:hypothetical protein
MVSNWEMAKECLRTNDKAFATRPKTLAMDILGYNYSILGFSPYGTYWRQIRKILTLEVLSNHPLEMFKSVREDEVRDAVGVLYQQWIGNKSNSQKLLVEMKRRFSDITLNVILKIIVSKRYVDYGSVEISTVLMMPSVRRLVINIVSILLVVFVSKRESVNIILSVKKSIFSV